MTLFQAMKEINRRPMTAWMAWGIIKVGDQYVIVDSRHMKNFTDSKYIHKRVGEAFPYSPIYTGSREFEKKVKKVW